MGGNTPLSDLIEACLSQNLPKEKLVTLLMESIQTGIRMLDENEDPCAAVVPDNVDQGLQIASVFIILAASSIGVTFPLLAKYEKNLSVHHFYVVLGKCAGTGVILACALVHMIQPSDAALTSECVPTAFNTTYPAFSYLFALVAALSMHLSEFLVTSYLFGNGELEETEQVKEKDKDVDDCFQFADKEKHQKVDDYHQQLASNLEQEKLNAKHIAEAYMLEFGVAVHSVLIGLAVGVSDKDTLVALLVALIFHQMFEGVALGSRLSDINLGLRNEVLLGAIFALSAPVGIAIGTCVSTTLNVNSQAFLLFQGIFDGICGGILLYTGFVFLLQDFPSDMELYCRGKHRRLMQAGMFITLWGSALLMAMIGMYL
jgi:zinc transporter 1/2/3